MVHITFVVTPSCAEVFSSPRSYTELCLVVRITFVVTPSCAEWYASQKYYAELRQVVRITIPLRQFGPSGAHHVRSYTELRPMELKWELRRDAPSGAHHIRSYAELRKVVRITFVVTPSCI